MINKDGSMVPQNLASRTGSFSMYTNLDTIALAEVRFLLQCRSLQKERWEIINNINEINKNFKSLDNRSKLVWLMSAEDSTIVKKTGRLSTYEKKFIIEKTVIRK